MARKSVFALLFLCVALPLFAQQPPPPPLPPAVGNAVLLATNSIQVDRDVVVTRGDLIVNAAATSPILGEKQLSLDQGVQTPAGFAVKANEIDIDRGATVDGDIYYNFLRNDGTATGHLITPLALPVIGTLPQMPSATTGTQNISLSNNEVRVLGTGNYGTLTLGRDSTLHIPGGPYAFASISGGRGATIVFDGPAEIVVNGSITFSQSTTITAAPGVTTKHKMISASGNVTFGKDNVIAATVFSNGLIDADQSLTLVGSFVARNIHISRSSTLTLRSGFRNLPPVANSQNVIVNGMTATVITLTGSDPDLDPLIFTLGIAPLHGTLGPVLPAGPTSVVVVYTPAVASPNDVFTFRVTDSEGFFANGVVTINEGAGLPGPPTTIDAFDETKEIPPGRPSILSLNAIGPPGVPITVSIVPGSGPFFGSLGPLNQPTPLQPAAVPYLPPPGFVGEDQFQFQACGVIDGNTVCDVATIRVAVVGAEQGGELAPDFTVDATSGESTPIPLSDAGAPPAQYRVMTLPATGTLFDASGAPITSVPYALPSPIVSYQSPAGFTGVVSFRYEASNNLGSDEGTVTVNVNPAPPPDTGGELAPDLTASTTSGSPVTISLNSGAPPSSVYTIVALPLDGTLRDGNGALISSVPYTLPSPSVTYTSSPSFVGTMRFTYSVNDGVRSDTGTITVTVTAEDNGRG